jgi:endonuclease G
MDSIGLVKRSNSFKADKQVNQGSASLADYKKSGFDRGHLVPAADMSFNTTAMKESFLMSNMAPQRASFNRGIWKQLESKVRNWTITYDSLVVISGCLTNEIDTTIGINTVAVPASFYKIIYDVNTMNAIAFVIPNIKAEKNLK